MRPLKTSQQKGFTLVEMIVAIGLFTIVMMVATGAIFSIVNANRNAQTINAVITNLDFSLESMLREMRTGYNYSCGSTVGGTPPAPKDCTAGGTEIAFVNAQGQQVGYAFSGAGGNGSITRTLGTGPSAGIPIAETAPEVNITRLEFYVSGTVTGRQPSVLVQIIGTAGSGKSKTSFDIQTYVSQRALNK